MIRLARSLSRKVWNALVATFVSGAELQKRTGCGGIETTGQRPPFFPLSLFVSFRAGSKSERVVM